MKKTKTSGDQNRIEIRKKPLKQRLWNARGYYLMFLPVLAWLSAIKLTRQLTTMQLLII